MQEQCTVSIYANICRDLFSRFSLLWENKSFAKLNEARHEKTKHFAYAKTKTQISFAVTAKLISAFVLAT